MAERIIEVKGTFQLQTEEIEYTHEEYKGSYTRRTIIFNEITLSHYEDEHPEHRKRAIAWLEEMGDKLSKFLIE